MPFLRPRAAAASQFILLFAWAQAGSFAAVYYVSPAGNDKSAGISASKPWKTIAKVNRTALKPGDQVLFQGGATFPGSLTFGAGRTGTAAAPVKVSTYGSTPATISSPNAAGINVYNAAGISIANLRIQGSGSLSDQKDGISFYTDLPGDVKLSFIEISNVEISGFGRYAISIGAWNNKSGFKDVRIASATTHHNGLGGICVWGPDAVSIPGYAHKNVYVGYSISHSNSGIPGYGRHTGDGIAVGDTDGGVLERNTAYNNGALSNSSHEGPVGIWVYNVRGFLIQHNESFENRTGGLTDGGGFDMDGGTQDSIMQYNFSHDNDGPGFLLCMYAGARPNTGNTIRYNISQNDGRRNGPGSIHLYSAISNATVYNNTIVLTQPASGAPAAVVVDGPSSNIAFRNNIFSSSVSAPLVRVSSGQKNLTFQANDYWSNGSPARISWGGAQYSGLSAWSTATKQEMLGSAPVGTEADPQFVSAGGVVRLEIQTSPSTATDFQLGSGSKLINAGIDLAILQTSLPEFDFYGGRTPRGAYDIGAHEMQPVEVQHLVAHWKLDESGPTATDASGNGSTGRVKGNPVAVPGQTGMALAFDGIDDYILTSGVPPVEEASFTVSAWVRPRLIPPGTGAANNAAYGIVIKKGYHLGLSYSGERRFGMNGFLSDLSNIGVESSRVYDPGQFYHVAGVIDRNTRTTKLYVNGELERSRVWPSALPLRNMGTAAWTIGIASPGASEWAWPADAQIDDVRIYNRALSDTEIAELQRLY